MDPLQPQDPDQLGPYHLLGRIGAGGMGVVYFARDDAGSEVAIKLIRPELADDREFRGRFRREVEAGRRVGGLCNARYLDANLDAQRPYLVTQYVAGGNLADSVAANGPLPEAQLIGLAVGLAEAIVAMHAVGVIHRDLKPSNVLLALDGPKVVDFGISHAAEETSLTESGVVIGSPSWMAPEQALGRQTTPAADVFSWGATVAFAGTGRPPFGEGRPEAVLYRVVHEEPDLEGLQARLRPLVAAALAKDPVARPMPDQLLVGVVQQAMAGASVPGGSVAQTTVVLDRTWRRKGPAVGQLVAPPSSSRNRRWAALGGAAGVAALALALSAVLGVFGGTPRTHNPRVTTTTRPSTTIAPGTTTPRSSTTTAVPATDTAFLPITVCPTAVGVPTQTEALPSTIAVTIPSDLANQLGVYADNQGIMRLLGPRGWVCTASYGADGSGGLSIYPTGEPVPNATSYTASSAEGIVASETSACTDCRESQACPLFASAQSDLENDYKSSCMDTRPGEESTEQISAGVIGFLDPPGVAGDGNPSGGPYPANGVMTYYSGDENGSWVETCTLPYSEQPLCTAVLNNFVGAYGNE